MTFIFDILTLLCLLLVLFLPYFIARSRDHRNKRTVFWVNLLLGWTLIVWVPLIIYSLVSDAKLQEVAK